VIAMSQQHGFTLIELMVAVAVVAILSAVALPSYSAYILRSKIPVGLDALASYQARMEQSYQDTGSYGNPACSATISSVPNFTLTCNISNAGQGFTATITGTGPLLGTAYSVDQDGKRNTLAHPKGTPSVACWTIRGASCDS
jgi:type IV pilus assembly protein PilE